MANLRVFVSSTYYDLHHVRNDLFNFLSTMGYEAVMHEKGGVPYSQDSPLEESCYDELSLCDIVICVIGNKYGTQSESGDYSITMKELQKAITAKKKVYTFIVKDVFIENATYEKNINKGSFEPAYVDNLKIHEFITELKRTVKSNPILPFESVDEIIKNLKQQFSGLFQKLLNQEATATEAKTYYDLQELSQQITEQIELFNDQREMFFSKFDSTIFAPNRAVHKLKELLGLSMSAIFIPTKQSLVQFMNVLGFVYDDHMIDGDFSFHKQLENKAETISISGELFDNEGRIIEVRTAKDADKYISYSVCNHLHTDDLPF